MKSILYFTAPWCSPCKILSPIMQELLNTYSITLGSTYPIQKIDVDENKDTKEQYGVAGIPTVIVLENGTEIKRLVGLKSKNEYIKAFES